MTIKNKYSLEIEKYIKHYKYFEILDQKEFLTDFLADYSFYAKGDNLKRNSSVIYAVFEGTPQCNHIAAKNLLFQGNLECWKFFDRTAHFLTYSQFDQWIDFVTPALNYSLYVQRIELIDLLLDKLKGYLLSDKYKTDKNYVKQEVYPSSYLIHFLLEKYGVSNPLRQMVENFGKGPGPYKRIIEEWDNDFSKIEDAYWDNLCTYHLKNIKGITRDNEEHVWYGLVPMELINIFVVRKKLGLSLPKIAHELFQTPMAQFPIIPTDYDPKLDVKFQLVDRTVKNKKKYLYEEIISIIKQEEGDTVKLFY